MTGNAKYDLMHACDPTLFFSLTLFSLGFFRFLSQLEVAHLPRDFKSIKTMIMKLGGYKARPKPISWRSTIYGNYVICSAHRPFWISRFL